MDIESVRSSGMAAYQPQSAPPVAKAEPAGSESIDLNSAKAPVAAQTDNTPDTDREQTQTPEAQQATQQQKLKSAVEELNKQMQGSEAIFGIHDKTNRVTIKIVDKETKEIIKEYPPEETLDMIAKVWELAGIMVDERR